MIEIFEGVSATCARCSFTPAVDYGKRFLKRYKFVGGSWVKPLHTKCTCPKCPGGQQHASLVKIGKKGDVTGKQKALKESQSRNLWSTPSYQTRNLLFSVHCLRFHCLRSGRGPMQEVLKSATKPNGPSLTLVAGSVQYFSSMQFLIQSSTVWIKMIQPAVRTSCDLDASSEKRLHMNDDDMKELN